MNRVVFVVLVACANPVEVTPPPPDHGLLGSWRYVPRDPTLPLEDRELLAFGSDGRYTIRDGADVSSGQFEIAGDDLTLHGDLGWITTGFAVTAEHLLVDALFPTGDNTGLTGTWRGAQSSASDHTEIELVLRDDGTAHLRQIGSLADETEATWIEEDPYALVTFANKTRPKPFPALAGLAIGEWLYERVPD